MQDELPFESVDDMVDSDVRATLNAVIAYGDVAAGQRAMRTLAHVTRKLGDEMELCPQPWRFEVLEDPACRALASADAVNADMLIISTSSESELPAAVESWITACLALKRGTSAAVVALLGSEVKPDELASPRFQFVQAAAREAGLDFFAPLPHREDQLDLAIENIRRRVETLTPTLSGISHPSAAPPHGRATLRRTA